jgi:hypothetical protein
VRTGMVDPGPRLSLPDTTPGKKLVIRLRNRDQECVGAHLKYIRPALDASILYHQAGGEVRMTEDRTDYGLVLTTNICIPESRTSGCIRRISCSTSIGGRENSS